jgi:Uma2 family endonuclease
MIATAPPEPKRIYRFTKEQYYRLAENGEFGDARVELINGEVVPMPAQSNWHAWGVDMMHAQLSLALGSEYWIRNQHSLDLSPLSVPDPDIAVIPGRMDSFPPRTNPTSAILIVEVSETTLGDDRVRKASLYAASGIRDYWILNYVHRCLEVYRDAIEDPSEEFGWRYTTTTTHDEGEVAMLAVPTAKVEVAKFFP